MKINDTDISKFNAKQWNVEFSHPEVSNRSEWPDGCAKPVMLPSTFGFKKCKLALMVKGDNRNGIWENSNSIIEMIQQPSIFEFEGFEHRFRGVLTGVSHKENSKEKFHLLTLELKGYSYLPGGSHKMQVRAITHMEEVIATGITRQTPVGFTITNSDGGEFVAPEIRVGGLCRNANDQDLGEITLATMMHQAMKQSVQSITVTEDGNVTCMTAKGMEQILRANIPSQPCLNVGETTVKIYANVLDGPNLDFVFSFSDRIIL